MTELQTLSRKIEWFRAEDEVENYLMPDTCLTGYEFHERIGHGMNGSVYRVSDKDNKEYATKVIPWTAAAEKEAKDLQLMSKHDIAPGFITYEKALFKDENDISQEMCVIVMELMEMDLEEAFTNHSEEMKKHTSDITLWLSSAKEKMQELKYQYLDISPGNLMLNFKSGFKVRIVDFEHAFDYDEEAYDFNWKLIFRCLQEGKIVSWDEVWNEHRELEKKEKENKKEET